ncbi:hypothetical protein SS50377_21822 [Spironucleus salmonicida]|uniref:Uncharacterized protein n=1 Tax=Spironucleus salmonicida TaxID=348837 RepID=V6LM59_9EUKA|nr:hypothetical protein SS50377_21822 [Spironucleus salmonicida]|eukprot:EST44791.1 Hypothetical protein SS50377_15299 [Spironucleus salmonicida]
MITLLTAQFGYCSPTEMNFYTTKFPQFITEWWNSNPNIFTSLLSSPKLQETFQLQKQQRIIVVGTLLQYLDEDLMNINNIIKDYKQIIQIPLPDDSTMAQYFAALKSIKLEDNDVILLPVFNCRSHDNFNPTETLYDRTNNYYKGSNQLPFSRIQSLEQIQESIQGYRDLFTHTVTTSQTYHSFNLQKLSMQNILIITSALDMTSSLQFNSLQFCHISPNYQPQTSIDSCFIAVPIGMGNRGINGTGNIGNGFDIVTKFYLQFERNQLQIHHIFNALKSAISLKKQNNYQIEGFGNGMTDLSSISHIIEINQQDDSNNIFDVITAGNIKSGQILQLKTFQILRIYVTARGSVDEFNPIYENTYKTSLPNNQDAMLKYQNIRFYICQKLGTLYIPQYIGQLRGHRGSYQYLIQSSQLWGQHIQNDVIVWFSFESDIVKVQHEIAQNLQIDNDLTVSLQFIGYTIDVSLLSISDPRYATKNTALYFQTEARHIYSACVTKTIVTVKKHNIELYGDDVLSIQFENGETCNIYFCITEQSILNVMQHDCARSYEFYVDQYSSARVFYAGIAIGIFFLIYYLIVIILVSRYKS